ncbi:phage tail tube protein, partial [Mycobacterium kansasii]
MNGEPYAEVKSIESKATMNRETVQMAGSYDEGSKITSISCEGSFIIHKIYSREKEFIEQIQNGEDVRFSIFVKLDDPSAYGSESVQL